MTVGNYIYGGFPYRVDLDDLITEALQVHCRIGSTYNHLGVSTATRDKRMAEIINRSILQFLRAVPGTGLTINGTITTVANQVNYDIPAYLQGLAINRIAWNNTGSDPINDGHEIKYITQAQFQNLPRFIQSQTITADFPAYWTFANYTQTPDVLTGTVAISGPNTTAALVGTGTLFLTELAAGDQIMIYGTVATVGIVNNDTSVTLTAAWPGQTVATQPVYLLSSIRVSQINLYPVPGQSDNVATVSYQQQPIPITQANVTNRTTIPVMITEVPSEFQNVLAMNLAINILTTDEMQARRSFLLQQYGEALDAVQKIMAAPEAVDNGTASFPGEPNNLVDTDSLFSGMASGWGR